MEARERGLEPDECYYFGEDYDAERRPYPHLAIEIVLSSGMDRLAAYAGLRVPEVWIWSPDEHPVHVLRGDTYERAQRSTFLPALDLDLFSKQVWRRDQDRAVRDFHTAITKKAARTERPRRRRAP